MMGVVIPFDGGAERPKPTLDALVQLTAQDMGLINDLILEKAQSHVELIPEIAGHLINSGGKRIRPMLTVAAARMCGYQGDHISSSPPSVEFMHTATLLHDDVVDESDMRRGKEAARVIWGNQASVLVGDYLLGQAFKMMVETGSLECLRILSDAACIIAEGEVLQLAVSQDTSTTEDAYLRVVGAKTAALFSAAARSRRSHFRTDRAPSRRRWNPTAATSASPSSWSMTRWTIPAPRPNWARGVGDDFRERKITLPVVLAFRRGAAEERNFWKRTLEEGNQTEADLVYAQKLMERHGSLADTLERASHYGDMAKDALAIFPTANGNPPCWKPSISASPAPTETHGHGNTMKKLPPRAMNVVMPFILSIFMSAIISLVSTVKAIGLAPDLLFSWLKAWGLSWVVAFPVLLVVLPIVRRIASLVVAAPDKR
jgi:octaprenyl-diphosphate synthase